MDTFLKIWAMTKDIQEIIDSFSWLEAIDVHIVRVDPARCGGVNQVLVSVSGASEQGTKLVAFPVFIRIIRMLQAEDPAEISEIYTIPVYPQEGKYHAVLSIDESLQCKLLTP